MCLEEQERSWGGIHRIHNSSGKNLIKLRNFHMENSTVACSSSCGKKCAYRCWALSLSEAPMCVSNVWTFFGESINESKVLLIQGYEGFRSRCQQVEREKNPVVHTSLLLFSRLVNLHKDDKLFNVTY